MVESITKQLTALGLKTWGTIGPKKCYFKSDGLTATRKTKVGKHWYRFSSKGRLKS